MKKTIAIISWLVVIVATIWMIFEPGFRPAVAILAGIAGVLQGMAKRRDAPVNHIEKFKRNEARNELWIRDIVSSWRSQQCGLELNERESRRLVQDYLKYYKTTLQNLPSELKWYYDDDREAHVFSDDQKTKMFLVLKDHGFLWEDPYNCNKMLTDDGEKLLQYLEES